MAIRFIPAPLKAFLSEDYEEREDLKREYDTFAQSDSDPIGQWLKLAKARGETSDSDQVLLTLITELHRKVDMLMDKYDEKEIVYLDLDYEEEINGVNFDYLSFNNRNLEVGHRYYMRLEMPIFPKRSVPMYVVAIEPNIVEIKLMHNRDRKEWDGYVTARERTYIRELKGS
jgi:hypothetical protein